MYARLRSFRLLAVTAGTFVSLIGTRGVIQELAQLRAIMRPDKVLNKRTLQYIPVLTVRYYFNR